MERVRPTPAPLLPALVRRGAAAAAMGFTVSCGGQTPGSESIQPPQPLEAGTTYVGPADASEADAAMVAEATAPSADAIAPSADAIAPSADATAPRGDAQNEEAGSGDAANAEDAEDGEAGPPNDASTVHPPLPPPPLPPPPPPLPAK